MRSLNVWSHLTSSRYWTKYWTSSSTRNSLKKKRSRTKLSIVSLLSKECYSLLMIRNDHTNINITSML